MSDSEPLVLVARDGAVATVTLNRPEALNALSRGLRRELVRQLRALAGDETVEVVVLTGAGRAFCAGLDLKELGGETEPDGVDAAQGGGAGDVDGDHDVCGAMRSLQRPIVGAINGVAITGGFEIALACDILLAAEEARFADTHALVGVVAGWGLSQRLPRLIGPMRAKELSLTGNFLDAHTAERWGLVNRVLPIHQLLPAALALAAQIAATDRRTREEICRLIDHGFGSTLGEGLAEEARASAEHMRREVTAEGVRARRAAIQERGRRQQG